MKLQQRLFLIVFPCTMLSVVLIVLAVYTAMLAHAKDDGATETARDLMLVGDAFWESDRLAKTLINRLAQTEAIQTLLSSPSPDTRPKASVKPGASAELSANQLLENYLGLQPDAKSLALVAVSGEVYKRVGESLLGEHASDFYADSLLSQQSPPQSISGALVYHTKVMQELGEGGSTLLGWVVYELDILQIKNRLSSELDAGVWDSSPVFFLQDDAGITPLIEEPISPTLSDSIVQLESVDFLAEANNANTANKRLWLDQSNGIVGRYRLPGALNLLMVSSPEAIASRVSGVANRLAMVTAVGSFLGICSFFVLLRFLVMRPFHRELETTHLANERLAYTDALTGMPNRRLFEKLAKAKLAEAESNGTELAVLFMDLDNFKNINDVLGHSAGDTLLQEINRRITETLGFNADGEGGAVRVAARLGGDEFVFLIGIDAGSKVCREAGGIAQQILGAVIQPIILHDSERVVSASVGIAHYPEHGTVIEDLIGRADTAMYEAKRLNKNGFAVYNDTILNVITQKLRMEADLREAMRLNQFELHYQPKYDVKTLSFSGAEALLRWNHPLKGYIPPDQFISVAEECGLINQMGGWVLNEACRQWKQWHDAGLHMDRVAVNVSPLQFELADLGSVVRATLAQHDCPATMLEIEMTESCLMETYEEIRDTLEQLRQTGVSVAIDDFGTGYSSLSLIASMPLDVLKVDRSFVTGLKANTANEKVVSTVVSLAQQLNLAVVAEGIESADELAFLRSINCDYAQGYFLNKPLTVADMEIELSKISCSGGEGFVEKAA